MNKKRHWFACVGLATVIALFAALLPACSPSEPPVSSDPTATTTAVSHPDEPTDGTTAPSTASTDSTAPTENSAPTLPEYDDSWGGVDSPDDEPPSGGDDVPFIPPEAEDTNDYDNIDEPPETEIINLTFEDYGTDTESPLFGWTLFSGSDPTTIRLDDNNPHGGSYCGRIEYSPSSSGWNGIVYNFDYAQNWTKQRYLSVWMRGDGNAQTVGVGVLSGSTQIASAYFTLTSSKWRQYVFDLTAMSNYHEVYMGNVNALYFAFGSGDLTIWVDDVQALAEKPAVAGDPVDLGDAAFESFESYGGSDALLSGAYAMVSNPAYSDQVSLSLTSENPHDGSYAAAFFTPAYAGDERYHGGFKIALEKPVLFTKDDQLTFWIRTDEQYPSQQIKFSFYGWYGEAGDTGLLDQPSSTAWTPVTYTFEQMFGTAADRVYISEVQLLGALYNTNRTFWVDDFSIEPLGTEHDYTPPVPPTLKPFAGDDFEGYGTDTTVGLPGYELFPGSDPVDIRLDASVKHNGSYSGKITYTNANGADWSALLYSAESTDWSGYEYLSFWLRGDGSAHTVAAGFFAGGVQCASELFNFKATEWTQFVFRLSDFSQADMADLSDVTGFYLTFGGGNATIWVDDIALSADDPTVSVPTTPTSSSGSSTATTSTTIPSQPEEPETPAIVEDFEAYADTAALNAAWRAENHPELTAAVPDFKLVTEPRHGGEQAASFVVSATDSVAARADGRVLILSEPITIMPGQELSLWFMGDTLHETYTLYLYVNGSTTPIQLVCPSNGQWVKVACTYEQLGLVGSGTVLESLNISPATYWAGRSFCLDDIAVEASSVPSLVDDFEYTDAGDFLAAGYTYDLDGAFAPPAGVAINGLTGALAVDMVPGRLEEGTALRLATPNQGTYGDAGWTGYQKAADGLRFSAGESLRLYVKANAAAKFRICLTAGAEKAYAEVVFAADPALDGWMEMAVPYESFGFAEESVALDKVGFLASCAWDSYYAYFDDMEICR